MKFTCVTLSEKPYRHNVGENTEYINYVSTFNSDGGLMQAVLKAVEKVTTPYFFVHDYDDPYPIRLVKPEKGILYGDFIFDYKGEFRIVEGRPWTSEGHLRDRYLIHKAICNTKAFKAVAPFMPVGDYVYEYLVYYFVAACFGAEYDTGFESIWMKKDTGLHKHVSNSHRNSELWLLENKDKAIALINAQGVKL